MVRPVQMMTGPVAAPWVCLKCGCQEKDRDWFIDIGTDSDMTVDGNWVDGVIYLCNRCMDDILVTYGSQLPSILRIIRNKDVSDTSLLERDLDKRTKEVQHLQKRLGAATNQIEKLKRAVDGKDEQETKDAKTALDSLDAIIAKQGYVLDGTDDAGNNNLDTTRIGGESETIDPEPIGDDSGTEPSTDSNFALSLDQPIYRSCRGCC